MTEVMGKLPAFQFYPADWMQDTRPLSLAAKGAWIDLLCAMWRSQTRGTLTLSLMGYSRLIGATVDQTTSVIKELTDMQICNIVTNSNGDVTLTSRRMAREERIREQTRYRVERFRDGPQKRDCNANVTPPSSSTSALQTPLPPSSEGGTVQKPRRISRRKAAALVGASQENKMEPWREDETEDAYADRLEREMGEGAAAAFRNERKKRRGNGGNR